MTVKLTRTDARQAEERTDQRRIFLTSTLLAAAALAAALIGFAISA